MNEAHEDYIAKLRKAEEEIDSHGGEIIKITVEDMTEYYNPRERPTDEFLQIKYSSYSDYEWVDDTEIVTAHSL